MTAEYGVEHAVVQALRASHQHVEQEQIPDKAKNDGGCGQTCKNKRRDMLLYPVETVYGACTAGDTCSGGKVFLTSVNAQVKA